MDSDALGDMSEGLVHDLPRRLLNSTCDSTLLTKEINRNLCNALNPQIRNQGNQLQKTRKKALAANIETI